MDGVLIIYFATGEPSRLQFIGNNSVDSNGFVINYDEIYDVKLGDRINGKLVTEHIYNLCVTDLTYTHELPVKYKPSKTNKSWKELND